MSHSVPIEAAHRLVDMLSDSVSNETKASNARWYAEMIIDKFLSDAAKQRLTPERFEKLTLNESIDQIKQDFSGEIIDALYLIKAIGDKSAHYKQGVKVTDGEAKSVVSKALRLFNLIIADDIGELALNATDNRATLFSVLLPSVREDVLLVAIRDGSHSVEYKQFLIHKYMLACVKNANHNKAKRFLADRRRKGDISEEQLQFELRSLQAISDGIRRGELPVPKNLMDVRRNFNEVLKKISSAERCRNARLISIIERLLLEIEPSEMKGYIGDVSYIV